MTIYLVR